MQRFAKLLESELRERGHRVQLLQPRARFDRNGAPPVGRAKWLGYLDKFVIFPRVLRRAARRADIVHICDHSNSYYVRALGQTPHLLTCHDMLAIRSGLGLVPENPTGATGKILQKSILRNLNRARAVACVSQNTRQQLLELTDLNEDAVSVIENGLNYAYAPMPDAQADALIQRYFGGEMRAFILHVGGNQWYKNRAGVLQIYHALREQMGAATPQLAMVGKAFTPAMESYCAEHRLGDIVRVSGASNEELRAFYSRAQAFLFPSLAEGFGWPIVEAQACGCRVLTTDLPPMNDIGAASALCDPGDVAGAAARLRALLEEDESQRCARVEAGLKNAERFTTTRMIERYEALYREIVGR